MHHAADVAKQFGGELFDQLQLRRWRGRLQRAQVQAQGGELVAGHVVQFAGDAQAFAVARAVGKQGARGQQVRIDLGQAVARFLGAARVVRGQCGEQLETAVAQHQRQRIRVAVVAVDEVDGQVRDDRQGQHDV